MDEKLVTTILDDWRTAPIDDKLRATLGLLEKLTLSPGKVGSADMEPLRAVGLSDEAIAQAIHIWFLFCVINRLADAFDFKLPTTEEKKRVSRFLFNLGYATGSIPG